MALLKRNNSTDLRKVSVSKKQTSFISFKKKNPGEVQVDQFVIQSEALKNDKYRLTGFIGNPYKLGLCTSTEERKPISDKSLFIAQDLNGDLYVVIHEDGAKLFPTHTWGKVNLTVLASYMFVVKELFNPYINNEYLFSIATETTLFTAVGENIEGKEFEGYKLTYKKALVENTPSTNTLINFPLGSKLIISDEELELLAHEREPEFDQDEDLSDDYRFDNQEITELY